MFVVSLVARFMHQPHEYHWRARLFYTSANDSNVVAYTDVDWVGSLDVRKSTSGYTFIFGVNLVSWSSKRKPTVALSTTEA